MIGEAGVAVMEALAMSILVGGLGMIVAFTGGVYVIAKVLDRLLNKEKSEEVK
tara:strand:+ start:91 stop:249 length:159 start_codon:yes stop_codon:yes gene_type:complete